MWFSLLFLGFGHRRYRNRGGLTLCQNVWKLISNHLLHRHKSLFGRLPIKLDIFKIALKLPGCANSLFNDKHDWYLLPHSKTNFLDRPIGSLPEEFLPLRLKFMAAKASLLKVLLTNYALLFRADTYE